MTEINTGTTNDQEAHFIITKEIIKSNDYLKSFSYQTAENILNRYLIKSPIKEPEEIGFIGTKETMLYFITEMLDFHNYYKSQHSSNSKDEK